MEKIRIYTSGVRVSTSTRKPDIDHCTLIADLCDRGYRVTVRPLDDEFRLMSWFKRDDGLHCHYQAPDSDKQRQEWAVHLISMMRNFTTRNVIDTKNQGATNATDQDPTDGA